MARGEVEPWIWRPAMRAMQNYFKGVADRYSMMEQMSYRTGYIMGYRAGFRLGKRRAEGKFDV
jgi:hypothetical protein